MNKENNKEGQGDALRVIISGGGTGGHIFPAVSIANAIKELRPDAQILFVGAEGRMEMQRVPDAGYQIIGLPVAGFDRKHLWKNVAVLLKLVRSQWKARNIIRQFRPQVAVGVGGYASGPTLKMAGMMGVPTLIQEQNSYAGVTNKLLAQKARRICVAYDGMEKFFPANKIIMTGNPVRQNLLAEKPEREQAIRSFGLNPEKKTILILGGSLGARTINNTLIAGLQLIRRTTDVQFIWQTGKIYHQQVTEAVKMDACDELGLFVIVNTPGWQFWNDAPVFAQRVYSDIRNLVRRDRNHPCVWMWEPILNETWYPADFARNAHDIVEAEYPYPYCYSGCDSEAKGKEHFQILFTHPLNGDGGAYSTNDIKKQLTYFTREWGDNVDDWNSHNSPSRVARNWGEQAMLIQAQHYARPSYKYTSYDALYRTPRQHVGGCLWHSFDHQRGYHPDPFYGGVMDVFRQPKYSYYMFMAQRSPIKEERLFQTGPMVYIAHEMTPFSGKDVTVYSNCDEVRLTYLKGGQTQTYVHKQEKEGMPHPVITFENVYDFMKDKALSRQGKQADVYLLAEGLIDGKVVATHKVAPARRPEKLLLWVDNEGTDLKADGSDFVTVIAAVADKDGNIKRLNNYTIKFQIEGEGRILGGAGNLANPAPIRWGTAPILVQSTLKPGKIKITASVLFEGSQMPSSAVLELESKPGDFPQIYDREESALIPNFTGQEAANALAPKSEAALEKERLQKAENAAKLKEVEQQQEEFGEKK